MLLKTSSLTLVSPRTEGNFNLLSIVIMVFNILFLSDLRVPSVQVGPRSSYRFIKIHARFKLLYMSEYCLSVRNFSAMQKSFLSNFMGNF